MQHPSKVCSYIKCFGRKNMWGFAFNTYFPFCFVCFFVFAFDFFSKCFNKCSINVYLYLYLCFSCNFWCLYIIQYLHFLNSKLNKNLMYEKTGKDLRNRTSIYPTLTKVHPIRGSKNKINKKKTKQRNK